MGIQLVSIWKQVPELNKCSKLIADVAKKTMLLIQVKDDVTHLKVPAEFPSLGHCRSLFAEMPAKDI